MKKALGDKETSDILFHIIGQNRNFNQQKIMESMHLTQIHRFFKDFLPQLLRDHIEVHKIHKGTLTITADHGIYAQQIQFKTREFLEKFHQNGLDFIQKIEVRTGKIKAGEDKTGDIMSQSEIMSPELKPEHENSDILDKLLSDLKNIK